MRFNSPVYPIAPSFDENEVLEFDSTNKYLKYLTESGVKTVMTTIGTSQYNLLSLEEIREFNKVVSTFDGEKIIGLPVVSQLHLIGEINLVNEYCDVDTTSILVLFPERYYDDMQVVEFFERVCDTSNFPVLAHGNALRKGKGGSYEYSKPLLEKLSKIEGFIGIKEESSNMMHTSVNLPEGLEIIVAGGSMKRFWALEPHGATTYLAGVGSFTPKVEEDFYSSYSDGDLMRAKNIMDKFEKPLFTTFMTEGWHLSMRTALKHMGFIKHDRKPFKQPSAETSHKIVSALNQLLQHEK